MASLNFPPGHHLHRKPLPDHSKQSLVQDRPPSIPASTFSELSTGVASSSTGSLTTDSSHPDVSQEHIRTQSDDNDSSDAMARLQKTAPVRPPPPIPPKEPLTTPPPDTTTFSANEAKSSTGRLKKRRSSSINGGLHAPSLSQPSLTPPQGSPPSDVRGRSVSAQPPTERTGATPTPTSGNHILPAPAAIPRPGSSNGSQSPTRDTERRGRLRRSWLPGRSRSHSREPSKPKNTAAAWILGQDADYNTSFLVNSEKVPELWNENGDVLVYLDSKARGGLPSFKVPSFVISYSLVFADLIEAEMESPTGSDRSRARSFSGRDNLCATDAERAVQSPPSPPPPDSGESRLYLPVSMSSPGTKSKEDLERLISIRNMFAFLTGQPLVATPAQPTLFSVFLNISALLKEFEFTNMDGSTFGDAVEMSFSFFMEQTSLADVRHSREKTLESLILGERMRSMELYNEAFAHAVGKYAAMRELNSPLWEQVSPSTRQRLERAHFELVGRQTSVNNRLESFEFPALFSGVANSTSLSEYKDVKFNTWKKSYGRMRHFTLNYYKSAFGSWPPKARSKKNPFTESGLNRQVLKILYSDLCALYDLIVDRESITTRVIDQNAEDIASDYENPHTSAMRKVLGEFDQSSPPVLPPIPFDLPKLPTMTSIKENFNELSHKERSRLERNLQEYQIILILNKAYDYETYKLGIPFLEEFKQFELKEAKGKTASEMADQRLGYWLFLYVVIQSLPMLVVDAPGLKFTEGVEYFLCQPPKGSPPWMEDAPSVRKRWYEVAGGGGLVELSEDAVEFSVEGIYHRSHCWLAAKRWELGEDAGAPAPHESMEPLEAPQSVFTDMDPATTRSATASPSMMSRSESPTTNPPGAALRMRTASPGGRRHSANRRSIAFGLEPVPMVPDPSSMPGSRVLSARGISPGQRPASVLMSRSRSSGNLTGLPASPVYGHAHADSRTSSRQESLGGSTFDDILKDMEAKPKKKKGFF
ncbi:hypothetical protein F4809DRAFT_608797 [Biscogniauxia mediterranea]|nr:hypothetical protein F4809DRAFT_608797 [Biscogniauxia mediterranea]